MIKATFAAKSPTTGLPASEVRAMYDTLESQRYAIVVLESVERVEKADLDADNVVKLQVVAIELPTSQDGQAELAGVMARITAVRVQKDADERALLDGADGTESILKHGVGVLAGADLDRDVDAAAV